MKKMSYKQLDELKPSYFFVSFCQSKGIQQKDIANILGVTQATVSYHFENDSFSFGEVQRVLDTYGYVATYDILRPGDEPVMEDMEKYLQFENGKIKTKTLTFLWLALKRYKLSKIKLAELLGVAYETVRHWTKIDDISIIRLFSIIRVLNAEFYVKIRSKKPYTPEPGKKGTVVRFTFIDEGVVSGTEKKEVSPAD